MMICPNCDTPLCHKHDSECPNCRMDRDQILEIESELQTPTSARLALNAQVAEFAAAFSKGSEVRRLAGVMPHLELMEGVGR